MRRATNEWPNTAASSGTLFFAQTMLSFLDIDEFEGFRAYALDTFARISEAVSIAEQVGAGTLSDEVLKPVAKELAWSLKSDRAAQSIAPDECELIIEQCEKKPNEHHRLLSNLRLLKRRLANDYREALGEQVVTRINDPKSRGELLAAVGFLASHLVNDGHSRVFISDRIKSRFFASKMKRVGAAVVKAFLKSIREERNDYRVVKGVDTVTEKLLTDRNGWTVLDIGETQPFVDEAVEELGIDDDYSRLAIRQVFAPDPYQAATIVNEELERLAAFMIIPPNPVRLRWSRECFVHRPRGTRGEQLVTVTRSLQKFTSKKERIESRAEQNVALFKKMDRAFDELSSARLTRAIATANAATKTSEDEARLISIWSAFEILSSDPMETKILHICRELVPCICIKYHRRVFASVYGRLSLDYKGPFRKLIRDTVGAGQGGSYVRFAKFILLPTYEDDRKTLLNLVADNPAALHRLYRLAKLYGEPATFRRSVVDHAERVGWQLRRIYRVRNSLIHAGESPGHLEALLSNALDYFRSCMLNLILVANEDEAPSDLDGTIAEIGLEWTIMQKRLSGAGSSGFDNDMIGALFKAAI